MTARDAETSPVMRSLLPLTFLATVLQGGPLTLLGYHATPPAHWVSRPPTSSMRLAMFTVPPDDHGEATEVVVFFFGASQGGNVAANTARWRDQFTNSGAPAPTEKVTRDSSGAFPITIAEYEGSYRRGIGAGSADSVRANQGLTAAIVETPKGTLFVQLFGPVARVRAEHDRFVAFVKGIR
ncbi:MAG TPA: hypothetical protein VG916_00575 [Gemmatimonadaceae bacterium]|nr:hypothetical protein [Gemmatimonadaceae bacterium]